MTMNMSSMILQGRDNMNIKMYPKIRRPDNSTINFNPGDMVVIQEKIDGSNVTIYKADDKIRYFSRNHELVEDDKDFKRFLTYIKTKEEKLLSLMDNNTAIFGEFLSMGKIGYNTLAKNEKISCFYVFDVADSVKIDEEGVRAVEFANPIVAESFAVLCGLDFVPVLAQQEFQTYAAIKKSFVEDMPSCLDNTFNREGVVIKSVDDPNTRLKIVADKFAEIKPKRMDKKNPLEFITCYMTEGRIEKFLTELNLEDRSPEQYGVVFKNVQLLVDDIFEEESAQIQKDLEKAARKASIGKIKNYLEKEVDKEL